MNSRQFLPSLLLTFLLCVALCAPGRVPADGAPTAGAFAVEFDTALQPGAYSGRVYIVFGGPDSRAPFRAMSDWFNPPQVLAEDLAGVAPGKPVPLASLSLGHPKSKADISAGTYTVQAGDLYSKPMVIEFKPGVAESVTLRLTEEVKPRPFHDTEQIKLFEQRSALLSDFHGRDFTMRASVLLPKDWEAKADERWPVVYYISGFNGSHREGTRLAMRLAGIKGFDQMLHVFLDATCSEGHSVFADSANTGPWGTALIEEFVPAIEAKFRGAADPDQRYVWGMSSGGWGSLWLQVTWPDHFAGCWSHCPDPVDFRDFQRINLYEGKDNFYTLADGSRRPLARGGEEEKVLIHYEDFVAMEEVYGHGGQIKSFEAVFSPRGTDGRPVPLFDRQTGAVDPAVAKAWEAYDIRLVVERNWPALAPKVAGKIHVYAGGRDTFYLEGSTVLLKEAFEKLGSDAVVEIIPDKPHTIFFDKVSEMIDHVNSRRPAMAASE
jgi:enterochelin esterase-like enzyme